jgi:hypothetical protein
MLKETITCFGINRKGKLELDCFGINRKGKLAQRSLNALGICDTETQAPLLLGEHSPATSPIAQPRPHARPGDLIRRGSLNDHFNEELVFPVLPKKRIWWLLLVPRILSAFCIFVLGYDLCTVLLFMTGHSWPKNKRPLHFDCPQLMFQANQTHIGFTWQPWMGSEIAQWMGRHLWDRGLNCQEVPHIKAIWAYMLLMPLSWGVVIWYSKTVWLLFNDGKVAKNLITQIDEVAEQFDGVALEKFKQSWSDKVRQYVTSGQGGFTVIAVGQCKKGILPRGWLSVVVVQVLTWLYTHTWLRSWKWWIAHQLVWFGFAPMLLMVRPALKFYVDLTQCAIDTFIFEIYCTRRKQDFPDAPLSCDDAEVPPLAWSSFVEKHHRLESNISEMWRKLGMTPWIVGFPFLVMAGVTFSAEPDPTQAFVAFGVMSMIGAGVVWEVLRPLANISSMFGSCLAYRSTWRPFQGKMSIVAVVRRFGKDKWIDEQDHLDYQVFLDYLHGFHYSIALPIKFFIWPVAEIPITKEFVAHLLSTTVVKFPALILFLLYTRKLWMTD